MAVGTDDSEIIVIVFDRTVTPKIAERSEVSITSCAMSGCSNTITTSVRTFLAFLHSNIIIPNLADAFVCA